MKKWDLCVVYSLQTGVPMADELDFTIIGLPYLSERSSLLLYTPII